MAQASAEKPEHTGPAEKGKSGLSATERAVGKYVGAALAKNKKQAVCPEYQIMRRERVKVGAPWRERGRSKREHEEVRVDFTVNEVGLHGGKEGQAKRASLEQVEGSMSG